MMSGSQLTFAVNNHLAIESDIVSNNGLGGGNTSINGVTKLGTGTVHLNGVNTYTANTTISQGTLVINGTTGLPTNNTTVNNGGTLRGSGTIYGSTTVESGGILSPGNSIGILHLVGPLTIQSDGRLTIEANDTGASSLLDITGTASLNGTLHMDFATGDYSQGELFTILTATGGVSGVFSTVESNGSLTIHAIYNPNSVQLLIESFCPPLPPSPPIPPISFLSLAGITGNAKAVGNYLNSINTEPFLQQELIALAELPSDQLNKALQSISPASKSFSTYVSQNTMFTVNKVAMTRMSIKRLQNVMGHQNPKLSSLFQESISQNEGFLAANEENTLPRGSTTRAAASQSEHAVWASALGDFMHQKAEKQNPAFHVTSPGGLVGVETYSVSSVLLGAAAGYAHSDITMNQQAGHGDIDYYVVGMYETTYINNGYIELCLWGTYNQFYNERHIVYPGFDKTAHSSHHGWQITPSVSAGYDFG
ncbi:MAG TPA: autotransporter domain-containing protein, partial [Chlamydiales bacterium]|nr:autotransporter domain-containing protein [Chlamydiales bacterium]